MKKQSRFVANMLNLLHDIHRELAICNEDNSIYKCSNTPCSSCVFYRNDRECTHDSWESFQEGLYAAFGTEFECNIDWSSVSQDTRIYVSDDGNLWFRGYFAKYEDGHVYAYTDGSTSWSCSGLENDDTPNMQDWKYARLATLDIRCSN